MYMKEKERKREMVKRRIAKIFKNKSGAELGFELFHVRIVIWIVVMMMLTPGPLTFRIVCPKQEFYH